MTISTGTRLGPYEVIAPIGAGGMGEVYKATDTRLDRTVAIKVLPEHLAESPERKARFEREAKAISQLNHPHICTLYDVGEQDGIDFIVMEYIEGETLAERLKKGALKLDQALEYGIQIADGLDKAHRAGIIHRDLKPGNVMLTKSGVKLLDFGLARLVEEGGDAETSDAPTRQKDLTAEESIIGTLQYMAPEQLERKPADTRTDIFAFGVVLYEMVTGKRAFEGSSQASLISAIMSNDPPAMASLQAMTPPFLEHVVKTCLVKEPEERWQSAVDLRRELVWIRDGVSLDTAPRERRTTDLVKGLVVGAAAAASIAVAVWNLQGDEAAYQPRMVRSTIELPSGLELEPNDAIALSPDGELLAFAAMDGKGAQHLYLRPLDEYEAVRVSGTEGAESPFFSPDGNWIGFFTRQGIQKVSVGGGAVVSLARNNGAGATWTSDGQGIVFHMATDAAEGLVRIPSDGGDPEVLTRLDEAAGEYLHAYPNALPGGIVFRVWSSGPSPIKVVSLETGDTVTVTTGEFLGSAQYSPTGHLIYGSSTLASPSAFELVALPFDTSRLEPVGPPRTVLEGVWAASGTTNPNFSISQNGTLAYVPAGSSERTLVWVDREARETLVWSDRGYLREPRLSPDGRLVAMSVSRDVWVLDLDRGTRTRIEAKGSGPVWTPDGRSLTFRSNRTGSWDLYTIPFDGSGASEPLLLDPRGRQAAGSWSPDGAVLVFETRFTSADIWLLPRDGEPMPFVESSSSNARASRFSPDGRYIAYQSDASGRNEIYVKPYPGPGGAITVSTGGGTSPVWSPDGRELFYLQGSALVAVSVSTDPSFDTGEPRVLFEGPYELHDVSPDGQQFLMIKTDESPRTRIHIVQNWFQELERLAANTK